MPVGVNRADTAGQLVTRAGAQHQAAEQRQVGVVTGGLQQLHLQRLQALLQCQQALASGCQACATATFAADIAADQWLL